jgi:hypothetical protein
MAKKNITEPESNHSESNSANCVVCFEKIHPRAKKCIHCDSFQDWRRHINFGSTVLALLVALVSVLSLSIPVLKDALTIPNSKIIFSYQSVRNDVINVIASNTGEEAGSIVDRGFICKEKRARQNLPPNDPVTYDAITNRSLWGYEDSAACIEIALERGVSEDTSLDFLSPKDSKHLKFRYRYGERIKEFLIDSENPDNQVLVLLQAVQFDGSREDYIFHVPVKDFMR